MKSLINLSEATDRILLKTSDVRLCLPSCPEDDARISESMSPLAFRLKEIEDEIARITHTLNTAASEIEL